MNKLDLFITACKAERWKWRAWRACLFNVTTFPDIRKSPEPYDIDYSNDGIYYYCPDESKWIKVDDVESNTPLYKPNELAKFPKDSIPNHEGAIETTYGRMLFNWMVMCHSFGDGLEFFENGTPSDLETMIAPLIVDYVEGESPPPGKFTVRELEQFIKGMFEQTSLCELIAPTGSERSLRTHPDMSKLRAELFEKHKDELDDPVVISKIQDQLIALDKEWVGSDESKDYYIDKKDYSVRRKKLFLMHGIEDAFSEDGSFDLIQTPLSDGVDITKLPATNNSIREGSYDRGSNTALGGEKVTFLQRIFQNAVIVEGDCGTKRLDRRLLTEHNAKRYIGLNMVVGKNTIPLTAENTSEYIGKVVAFRRPILCNMPKMDFCSACTTRSLADNPRAVAAEISEMASNIMYAFMASMHGVELKTTHYDFNNQFH